MDWEPTAAAAASSRLPVMIAKLYVLQWIREFAPPVTLRPVLPEDELVHTGHNEGQHATLGCVDQALLDEFVARD